MNLRHFRISLVFHPVRVKKDRCLDCYHSLQRTELPQRHRLCGSFLLAWMAGSVSASECAGTLLEDAINKARLLDLPDSKYTLTRRDRDLGFVR